MFQAARGGALALARSLNTAMVDHVAVLVLGDVGRSPRMQYHALSLSELSSFSRSTSCSSP